MKILHVVTLKHEFIGKKVKLPESADWMCLEDACMVQYIAHKDEIGLKLRPVSQNGNYKDHVDIPFLQVLSMTEVMQLGELHKKYTKVVSGLVIPNGDTSPN